MKKLLILISFMWVTVANAQDEAVFSQYTINPTLVNPGATGFNDGTQAYLSFKNQWTGFTGAPRNIAANINGQIGDKLGLGVMLNSETAGAETRVRGQLNYGFRFKINELKLGIGLSTQLSRTSIGDRVLLDPKYQSGDILAERAVAGSNFFDASAGVYGTYSDKIVFGVSALNLIQQRLGAIGRPTSNTKNLSYYTFMLGYKYKTELYTITPSLMVRNVKDAPFTLDVNVLGSFLQNRLLVGTTYRAGSGGLIGFTGGTKISNFQIVYTFEYGFSNLQKYAGGAHEVSIGYTFGKGFFKKEEAYKN